MSQQANEIRFHQNFPTVKEAEADYSIVISDHSPLKANGIFTWNVMADSDTPNNPNGFLLEDSKTFNTKHLKGKTAAQIEEAQYQRLTDKLILMLEANDVKVAAIQEIGQLPFDILKKKLANKGLDQKYDLRHGGRSQLTIFKKEHFQVRGQYKAPVGISLHKIPGAYAFAAEETNGHQYVHVNIHLHFKDAVEQKKFFLKIVAEVKKTHPNMIIKFSGDANTPFAYPGQQLRNNVTGAAPAFFQKGTYKGKHQGAAFGDVNCEYDPKTGKFKQYPSDVLNIKNGKICDNSVTQQHVKKLKNELPPQQIKELFDARPICMLDDEFINYKIDNTYTVKTYEENLQKSLQLTGEEKDNISVGLGCNTFNQLNAVVVNIQSDLYKFIEPGLRLPSECLIDSENPYGQNEAYHKITIPHGKISDFQTAMDAAITDLNKHKIDGTPIHRKTFTTSEKDQYHCENISFEYNKNNNQWDLVLKFSSPKNDARAGMLLSYLSQNKNSLKIGINIDIKDNYKIVVPIPNINNLEGAIKKYDNIYKSVEIYQGKQIIDLTSEDFLMKIKGLTKNNSGTSVYFEHDANHAVKIKVTLSDEYLSESFYKGLNDEFRTKPVTFNEITDPATNNKTYSVELSEPATRKEFFDYLERCNIAKEKANDLQNLIHTSLQSNNVIERSSADPNPTYILKFDTQNDLSERLYTKLKFDYSQLGEFADKSNGTPNTLKVKADKIDELIRTVGQILYKSKLTPYHKLIHYKPALDALSQQITKLKQASVKKPNQDLNRLLLIKSKGIQAVSERCKSITSSAKSWFASGPFFHKRTPELNMLFRSLAQLEENLAFDDNIRTLEQLMTCQRKRDVIKMFENDIKRLEPQAWTYAVDMPVGQTTSLPKVLAYEQLIKHIEESDVNESVPSILSAKIKEKLQISDDNDFKYMPWKYLKDAKTVKDNLTIQKVLSDSRGTGLGSVTSATVLRKAHLKVPKIDSYITPPTTAPQVVRPQ